MQRHAKLKVAALNMSANSSLYYLRLVGGIRNLLETQRRSIANVRGLSALRIRISGRISTDSKRGKNFHITVWFSENCETSLKLTMSKFTCLLNRFDCYKNVFNRTTNFKHSSVKKWDWLYYNYKMPES